MATKLTKIFTEHGLKSKIARDLNVNRRTVLTALDGRYATKKALKIRKYALENGGIESK